MQCKYARMLATFMLVAYLGMPASALSAEPDATPPFLDNPVSWPSPAATAGDFGGNPFSQSYSNLAAQSFLKRALEISQALSGAGLIPNESPSNAVVKLEGQSTRPSGSVELSSCQYEFREGLVHTIRRRDLFEDRGPASLILKHLTNEVLTLKKEAATNRAFEVLRLLAYDPERIQATHRTTVRDDLMDAYPIRNAGPDFPKDLHFFGELISRKKIKIITSMLAQIPPAQKESVHAPEMRIEFLATTGELLEAWWLPDDRVSKLLEIRSPEPIALPDTPDFGPPLFFAVTNKWTNSASSVTAEDAAAMAAQAWDELQSRLGVNRPKIVLVCDNLNQPKAIADTLKARAGEIPWAGVSHKFNMDSPFEPSLMSRLAEGKRGITLLAVAGNIQIQLELIPDLDAETVAFGDESDDAMQWRFKLLKEKFVPRVEPLLSRLQFPENVPDHVLFLMQPSANMASSVIQNELETRLRWKALVISIMGASPDWSIGQGVTYFQGAVFSNAIALVHLSGSLPLQADHSYAMAMAMARLSKAPPGYDLAKLQARGPARILSGEAIYPFRALAFGYGPHPMEEVVHFFGEKWIRFLQEADRAEVFRVETIRPRAFDTQPELNAPEPSGPKTPEGYKLLKTGATLDAKAFRTLAQALLDEQQGLREVSDCIFDPGVIFQIWHGKEYARLVVCFTCNESTLTFYDANGKVIHQNFPFHFSGRRTLIELAQKALPGDPVLEKLK
jgi:hypothetical protein